MKPPPNTQKTNTIPYVRTFLFTSGPAFKNSGADMGGVTCSMENGNVTSSFSPSICLNTASFFPASIDTKTV